jgi:hypothetical protein
VIGGKPQEGIDFDEIAKRMLDEILTTIPRGNRQAAGEQRDLFDILFAHIGGVCRQIVEMPFETLLLSSVGGHGFEEDLTNLLAWEKIEIFNRLVDKFFSYSAPSLPFRDGFIPDVDIGSLTISPRFIDPVFIQSYNAKNAATGAYVINGSPLLFNLCWFLNIRLADYYYLPELSMAKEKLERSEFPMYAQGAHLAEGADPEWNWSFMPFLDLPEPEE